MLGSPSPTLVGMCRNITTLRGLEPPATAEEIEAAARQYVRKVSGVQKPTARTEAAFEAAVLEIAARAHAQFEAVGLRKVDELLPGQSAGGMKQRVALARAMIMEPSVLLIDEPFSGLDPLAVRLIEALLVEVNHTKGLTMVLTNHHIGSTMRMADEIVFLVDGIAVTGSVEEMKASTDPRIQRFFQAAGTGPSLEEAS